MAAQQKRAAQQCAQVCSRPPRFACARVLPSARPSEARRRYGADSAVIYSAMTTLMRAPATISCRKAPPQTRQHHARRCFGARRCCQRKGEQHAATLILSRRRPPPVSTKTPPCSPQKHAAIIIWRGVAFITPQDASPVSAAAALRARR